VKTYIYNVFYRDGTARTEQYTGTWRGFCGHCNLTLRRSDVASLERLLRAEDETTDAETQHTRLMERTHHA
jgi:hypothetical protein